MFCPAGMEDIGQFNFIHRVFPNQRTTESVMEGLSKLDVESLGDLQFLMEDC